MGNHEIHQILQTSLTLLDQAAGEIDDETQALEAPERLRSVHGLITRVLDNIDPETVSVQPIANMVPHLNSLNTEVQAFVANQNPQHLLNANEHAENILIQIPTIVVMAAPGDITGLREAATSFRRSTAQLIRHMEEEATSLRQSIVKDHEQSDHDIEESKSQLVKLESQIEKVRDEIQNQKSRLDSAIAEFQNQFSKQQESRQEKFTAGEKERADANQLAIEEQEEEFDEICETAGEKLRVFHSTGEEAAHICPRRRIRFEIV